MINYMKKASKSLEKFNRQLKPKTTLNLTSDTLLSLKSLGRADRLQCRNLILENLLLLVGLRSSTVRNYKNLKADPEKKFPP